MAHSKRIRIVGPEDEEVLEETPAEGASEASKLKHKGAANGAGSYLATLIGY
jgi:hypothetical protein